MSSMHEWPAVRLTDDEMRQIVGASSLIPPDIAAAIPAEVRALVIKVVC